jgi:hypothetical protein
MSDLRVSSADPLTALADAMVEATAAVSSDTATAMALLSVYSPRVAKQVIPVVERQRLRMTPGALGSLEKIGNSLSIREFMQRITMNIGGGGG